MHEYNINLILVISWIAQSMIVMLYTKSQVQSQHSPQHSSQTQPSQQSQTQSSPQSHSRSHPQSSPPPPMEDKLQATEIMLGLVLHAIKLIKEDSKIGFPYRSRYRLCYQTSAKIYA